MLWLTMGCRGWGSGNHFWNQHPSRPSTALRRLMHCCGWGVGFQCGWLWDSLPARNSDPITLEELHEGPPPWLQVGLQMFMINPSMDMSTIYNILYIYVYVHNISTNRIFTQTTCRALSCSWGCRHRHSKHSVSRLLQQKAAVLLIGQVSRVAWGHVGLKMGGHGIYIYRSYIAIFILEYNGSMYYCIPVYLFISTVVILRSI